MSPFVDAFIVKNIVRRCVFKQRTLMIVTRFKSLQQEDKDDILAALKVVREYERKDDGLRSRISWYENNRLHAKFVVRDWEEVLFGSQNLTHKGGLTRNYELGALVADPSLVLKLKPFVQLLSGKPRRRLYPKGNGGP